MTAVHHHVAIAVASGLSEHTITIEPLTAALRVEANLPSGPHNVAIVERFAGSLVKVCDTNTSDWHASARAAAYARAYDAVLMLTAVQLARGDTLTDQEGAWHTVTSVYPVDGISLTIHTDTGHHEHLTWSEAHTRQYIIDTKEVR
jgi:hypothetical protein